MSSFYNRDAMSDLMSQIATLALDSSTGHGNGPESTATNYGGAIENIGNVLQQGAGKSNVGMQYIAPSYTSSSYSPAASTSTDNDFFTNLLNTLNTPSTDSNAAMAAFQNSPFTTGLNPAVVMANYNIRNDGIIDRGTNVLPSSRAGLDYISGINTGGIGGLTTSTSTASPGLINVTGQSGTGGVNVGGLGSFDNLSGTVTTTGTTGTDDDLLTSLLTGGGGTPTEIVTTGTKGTDDELKTSLLTGDLGTPTEIVTTGTKGTDDDLVTNLLTGDAGTPTEIVTTGTKTTDDDLVTNLLTGDAGTPTEIITTGTKTTDDELKTNLLTGDAGTPTEIITTGTKGTDDTKLKTGVFDLISAVTGVDLGDVVEIVTKAKDPKKLVIDTLGSLGLGSIDIGDFGGDFTFDDSSFANVYVDPRVGDFSGTNDNTTAGTSGGDGRSIPQRTAIRSVVPGTYDPNRRAGSGGQRYFSDVQYVPNVADPAAQRAANLATQAQTNTQAMQLAYQNALNPAYQTRPGTATDRARSMVERAVGISGMLPTAQVGAGLTPAAATTGTAVNPNAALEELVQTLISGSSGTTGGTTGTTGTTTGGTTTGGTTTTGTTTGGTTTGGTTTGGTTAGAGITTPAADTDTEYNNFADQFLGRQLTAEDAAAIAASGYSLNRLAETFKADPENLRSFVSQQTGGTATLDDGTTGRAGMANLLEELGGTKNADGTVTDNFGTTFSWQDGAFRPISEVDAFARNFAGKTLSREDLVSIGASGYDTAALASALKVDPDRLSGAVTSATELANLTSQFTGDNLNADLLTQFVDSGFSADTLAEALNVPGFTGDMLADMVNAQLNNQTTTTAAAAAAGTDIVDALTGTTTTDTSGAGTDIVETLLNSTEQWMVANRGYVDNGDGTITDSTNGYVYDNDTGESFLPTTADTTTDTTTDTAATTGNVADTTTSSLELFAKNNAGKTLTTDDLVALNNLAGEGYSTKEIIDTLGMTDAEGNPISDTQLTSTLNRAVGTNTLNTIAADTDGLDENQVRDIAGLITSNTLGIGDVANTFGVSGMDVVAELFNAGYETGADLTDRLGAFNEGLTEVDLVSNLLNSGKTDVNTVAEKYNTTPEAVQAELDKVNEQKTLDYLAGLSDEEVGNLINEDKLSIGQAVRVYQDRYPGLTEADVQAAMKAQGFAQGGNVNGYYLGGPTDGMADQIPATINNMQPAALSDGEFVIPADVVSHLGNGNSDSGAKELYSMMDRIRQDRTGTTKQGRQIDPNKYLA